MPMFRCKETYALGHMKLSSRRKADYCVCCGHWTEHLCDFIVGKRTKTCDAPLCWECAMFGAIALEVEFCPRHFNHFIETGETKRYEPKD